MANPSTRRLISPSEIVGFLQNCWFPEETPKPLIDRYLNDVVYRREILGGCRTGQMLKAAFGEAYDEIWWDNASQQVGKYANSVNTFDANYVAKVIRSRIPRLVLCFGNIAQDGVKAAELLIGPPDYGVLSHPHPTSFGMTHVSMNDFALRALSCEVEEIDP